MTILLYLRKNSNMLERSLCDGCRRQNKKGELVFALLPGGGC
jgi:hypothetical protein